MGETTLGNRGAIFGAIFSVVPFLLLYALMNLVECLLNLFRFMINLIQLTPCEARETRGELHVEAREARGGPHVKLVEAREAHTLLDCRY